MGSSEFSFAQDGHQGWRSSLLFLPQWQWQQCMLMPQSMVTPPPQHMAQLNQSTTLPLSIINLNLTTNLNLSIMLLLFITQQLLFTMLLQFTMLLHTMHQFIMLQQLTTSLNLIITNLLSAP